MFDIKEVINIIIGFCFVGLLAIGLVVITIMCLLNSKLNSYEKCGLLMLSAVVFSGGYFFLKDAIISDYKKIKNEFSKRG